MKWVFLSCLLIQFTLQLAYGASIVDEQERQWSALADLPGNEPFPSGRSLLGFNYHHYEDMTQYLRDIQNAYPHLTSLYSIGQSVQGRDLWVLMISSNPQQRKLLQPEVKYVGNIHGNEPVGKELLLHLIEYMLSNYEQDSYIRWLIDSTQIHILPSMNPDGFEASREGDCQGVQGRYNSNGQDLNRNFPDLFKGGSGTNMQPEASAISRWVKQHQFILSAGLHGGALVASYPFDNKGNPGILNNFRGYQPSLTPDDDTFRHLATMYSFNHRTMSLAQPCYPGDSVFPNGTTNGAAWYYLAGGMQDFNYVWNGCMELTLELSCCKYPKADQLPGFWEDNREAMIKYLGEAHRGVLGIVKDTFGNPVPNAQVRIKSRDFGVKTTPLGEYWRILLPGIYTIQVSADGYFPFEEDFQVFDGSPTLVNVTLQPGEQNSAAFHDRVPPPGAFFPDHQRPQKRPSIFSSISNFFGGIGR